MALPATDIRPLTNGIVKDRRRWSGRNIKANMKLVQQPPYVMVDWTVSTIVLVAEITSKQVWHSKLCRLGNAGIDWDVQFLHSALSGCMLQALGNLQGIR